MAAWQIHIHEKQTPVSHEDAWGLCKIIHIQTKRFDIQKYVSIELILVYMMAMFKIQIVVPKIMCDMKFWNDRVCLY